MGNKIQLTESELIKLIKQIIEENDEFEDELEFEEPIDPEGEFQDLGLDYEEDYPEDEFQMRMKSKYDRGNRPSKIQYGRMDWKKEYEKPYSPIKPSDLPLDKLYKNKNK
jgi:hypothetical protein